MKKKLLMIGGPMGIGKTTVCKKLYQMINQSVWLDGDWCWMMHPWKFSETNKKMVLDNIVYLLNNFLKNDTFQVVIFDWVLHQDEIYQKILSKLKTQDFEVYKFSLIANEDTLRQRLENDHRDPKVIGQSLGRLKAYQDLDTIKVDTSRLTSQQVAVRLRDFAQIENLFDGDLIMQMPRNEEDWANYHDIRKREIYDTYLPMVEYDCNHPSITDSNYFYYSLWQNDRMIGVAAIEVLSAERAAIRAIAISKNLKNQGMGTQFLKILEQKIQSLGCYIIQFHANPPAFSFYERNGYIRMPFPEGRKLPIEVIDMGKKL